ncbi:hypothetical protein BJ508DRAFT_333896 [Ascobolus immersus RN42]|uniref:Uncharacterized protein n=1 Tax=Ascobolus immersus RN42 TaxID=1160509 RepID=A0A3N4HI70_ASCIM|nr:hypothetical protein BJ508DRAFT_333896 [Ascobolus immersus RN42]
MADIDYIFVTPAVATQIKNVTIAAFAAVIPQITVADFHNMPEAEDLIDYYTNLISHHALREILSLLMFGAGTANTIVELATCISETTEVLFCMWLERIKSHWYDDVHYTCMRTLACTPEEIDPDWAREMLDMEVWEADLARRNREFEVEKERALERACLRLEARHGMVWAPSIALVIRG